MTAASALDRRALSRALSRAANATVPEALRAPQGGAGGCRRIGFTGPPGSGKSSLIARLARRRLHHAGELAIVAIDPTSPVSGGAFLGDRIRMGDLATDPRIYIRSLASRNCLDGLADNLADIFEIFDRAGFAEMIVETVGVGQVECAVRNLVDTTVLVLMPGAGDQMQAMKCGILETVDIYAVNKADQPGARRFAADLRQALKPRGTAAADWVPPVLLTSADGASGIDELSEAIDRHQALIAGSGQRGAAQERRRMHHVGSLVARRVNEVLRELPKDVLNQPMNELYGTVVRRLSDRCARPSAKRPST